MLTDVLQLALLAASVIGILCFAIAAIALRRSQPRRNERFWRRGFYEDQDGKATSSAVSGFSNIRHKRVASLFSLLGLAYSTTIFSLTIKTFPDDDGLVSAGCLRIAAWLFIFAQCICLHTEAGPTKSYDLGLTIAASTLLLMLNIGCETYGTLVYTVDTTGSAYLGMGWVYIGVELACSCVVLFAAITIPRRPQLFHKRVLVDEQYTISALKRYTYAWASGILDKGRSVVQLDFIDLPSVHHRLRARHLLQSFTHLRALYCSPLWLTVYRAHASQFQWLWILTTLEGAMGYAPLWFLYKFLTTLDAVQSTGAPTLNLWMWVFALGLFRMAAYALSARVVWFSGTALEVPIRSQLSSLIYRKSLKMKHMHFHGRSLNSDEQAATEASNNAENPDHSGEPNSTQSIVNLLGVDANRVAEFSARQYMFLYIFVTFAIGMAFLIPLIGWAATLAGLLGPVLLAPLNAMASQKYGQAQKNIMRNRDRKVVAVNEALQGIRQIKFSATEQQWQDRIMGIRRDELQNQRSIFIWLIGLRLFWVSSPILLSVISLATYALHTPLTAPTAFTAMSIFANLEFALSLIPFAITQLLDALVSCRRIEGLLDSDENTRTTDYSDTVSFRNVSVAWPGKPESDLKTRYALTKLDLDFPRGELSILIGKTGAGKSLLLASIIGEADVLSGSISSPMGHDESSALSRKGSPTSCVAYVTQDPWLENASIKDNILFGDVFDSERYTETLRATALDEDLRVMPRRDLTPVGPQGIALSGGQRWRLTLARALYSNADTLVIDDIFSAVDAHIARFILENSLFGPLGRNRTKILATHHVSLCLPRTLYAVVIDRDSRTARGLSGSSLRQLEHAHGVFDSLPDETQMVPHLATDPNLYAKDVVPLDESEFREQGSVKWYFYKKYLASTGAWWLWACAIVIVVASQFALLGRGWWVKMWTAPEDGRTSANRGDEGKAIHGLVFYLVIYVFISLSAALLEAVKCSFVYLSALRTSRQLFAQLTFSVLRAKLFWLNTTPLGRILNRFTVDFTVIDLRIPGDTHMLLSAFMSLGVITVGGLATSSYIILPEIALIATSVIYAIRYLGGAREVKRLESLARSPILELHGTSLRGLTTLRAFGKSGHFMSRMLDTLDVQSKANWSYWLVTQWMDFRMGILGSLFTLFVAMTITIENIEPSLAGFALNFTLSFTQSVEDAINRWSSLQLNMNATERVVEYGSIETEESPTHHVSPDWPHEGNIKFKQLYARYATHLPDVLKGIDLEIAAGSRVGIIGRTGAGKSSLALALFRCLDMRSGSILIGDLDTAKVPLDKLRRALSIIPQDPVLFSGTLRSNLDPFQQYDDDTLHEALDLLGVGETSNEKAEALNMQHSLAAANNTVFTDLDGSISEGGFNLSQGQRQLLCLARALLSKTKIMVMDEATSSVDMATDSLIQASLRQHFQDTTLLVVAHRLSTVADFDQIAVVAEGRISEYGTPRELFAAKGEFYRLVCESGERAQLEKIVLGMP
ncbi:putative ABC transporter [Ophiobolus disseminans]|uniref:Putative ABC transporter n=1 Tax=Ophiobolus disseminans TaxID=1469910 RepID=A0A6A7ALA6_9PLEO|nr:putative ABC transporter [Ophiobolus disseminans]